MSTPDHTKLSAGQIKAIKLKIKDLSDLVQQVQSLEYQAERTQGFDPDFAKETTALRQAVINKIKKLKSQLDSNNQIASTEFDKFWQANIAANCSEILPIYKKAKRVLYRGVIQPKADVFVGRSMESRKPKDSNKFAQALYDDYLTKLGIKALRSNSIFTTADYHQASGYGEVFIIIPVNGFNFSYSDEEDLVLNSINALIDRVVLAKIAKILEAAGKLKQFKVSKNPWSDYYLFDGTDIKRFFNKIKADPLIGKIPYIESLTLDNLLNIKKFVARYKPLDKDLTKPMKEFKEICINGSYYAFSYKTYGHLIEKQLGINISGSSFL